MFMLLFVSGCALAPFLVGPAIQVGIMWMNGEATKYYFNDEKMVEGALKAVLKDMEWTISEETNTKGVVHMTATNAKDKKQGRDRVESTFHIKLDPVRHNVTKLCIRVGVMGDKPYAEMIYREVDKRNGIRCFQTTHELKTALNE